jgi:replicative DNA helicase
MTEGMPWDRDAEEALIGAMLLSGDGVRSALRGCAADDLWSPELRSIYEACEELHRTGRPIDPVTVQAALADVGVTDVDRKRLMAIQAVAPISGHAGAYAEIIVRYSRARAAISLGADLREAGLGTDWERLDELADEARARLAPAVVPMEATELEDLWAMAEAEREEPTKPWVIPACLRHGEVIAYTGAEGGGKSMWLRQIGVCVAAGIHPLSGIDLGMERHKVLFVDLQEDEVDMADELIKLRKGVERHYRRGWYAAAAIREGLDLLSPRGQRTFEGLLEQNHPELVLMGPVVKTFRAPDGRSRYGEDVVDELTHMFDEWMSRYGFALVLEGHAGNERSQAEDWRIRGSSVWRSWPAFSHGIKLVTGDPHREAEVVRARGDRYAGRCWPTRLYGGGKWRLPWQCSSGDYDRLIRALGHAYLLDDPEQQEFGAHDGAERF